VYPVTVAAFVGEFGLRFPTVTAAVDVPPDAAVMRFNAIISVGEPVELTASSFVTWISFDALPMMTSPHLSPDAGKVQMPLAV
jgi:hypothetical protein